MGGADPGGSLANTGSTFPAWALLAVAVLSGTGLLLVRRGRRTADR